MVRASTIDVHREQFWLDSRQRGRCLDSGPSSSFAAEKVMEVAEEVEATEDAVCSTPFQGGCVHVIPMCCLLASELMSTDCAEPLADAAEQIHSATVREPVYT